MFTFKFPRRKELPVAESVQPVVILNSDGVPASGSGLPYGADNYAVTARDGDGNPTTIVYKLGATVLKARTITYADGKLDTSADA